jgi:hypothetical protein
MGIVIPFHPISGENQKNMNETSNQKSLSTILSGFSIPHSDIVVEPCFSPLMRCG